MKNKMAILGVLMLFLVSVLALSANAQPVTIDSVEVEGTALSPSDTTRLDLERGQDIRVRIEVRALDNASDLEITAFISGYEYSDYERISDSTHVFDVEAGVRYVRTLDLRLPPRVEEDDYLLRIMVTDRDNDALVENYRLKIDVPRHALEIRDVIFSPEEGVQAGRALLTTVRVKNIGERDEDSVKIKVRVPALGISASDYIDEIEADDSTTSEELYMRIPVDAEPGDYTVKISVEYDEGFEEISTERLISVFDAGAMPAPVEDKDKTVITVSTEAQDLVAGEGGVVYPITLSNEGSSTRTYVVDVEGIEGWATARITPSNVVVLAPDETQTVFVYLTADASAQEGQRMFSVSISAADKVLKQIPMTANVVADGAEFDWEKLKEALWIAFVVLLVILVVLALIIGFSRLREEEPEEISGQTYY